MIAENMNISHDQYNLEIGWGGEACTPISGHDPSLLSRVTKRLFIGTVDIGGKVFIYERIPGYTQIKIDPMGPMILILLSVVTVINLINFTVVSL